MKLERGSWGRVRAERGVPVGREGLKKSQHRRRLQRACVGAAGDNKLELRGPVLNRSRGKKGYIARFPVVHVRWYLKYMRFAIVYETKNETHLCPLHVPFEQQ